MSNNNHTVFFKAYSHETLGISEGFGARGPFFFWTCYQWRVGMNSLKYGFKKILFHTLSLFVSKLKLLGYHLSCGNFIKLWEKTQECAPQVLNLSFNFLQEIFLNALGWDWLSRFSHQMLKPKVEEYLNWWISAQSFTPHFKSVFLLYSVKRAFEEIITTNNSYRR